MASGPVVNQGKTAFIEKFFADQPDGKIEAVNEAWEAAGHEGSVSESLVSKVRARLGLTGRKAADEPKPKKPAKAKRAARPVDQAPPSGNGSSAPAAAAATSGHEDDILDELEEGIDELLHRLRELGGRPDVVKALRRARRLLVRGQEA